MGYLIAYLIGCGLSALYFTYLWKDVEANKNLTNDADYKRGKLGMVVLWPLTLPSMLIMHLPDMIEDFELWMRHRAWERKIKGGR